MCGITGALAPVGIAQSTLHALAGKMAYAISHRGPDDGGTWADESSGIALGHRRLAIVDLSAAGHQPMHSKHGRYVIAFNGEIYNHQELRSEIEALTCNGRSWLGHSDTETLLAAIEIWGVERTLQRCVGMFAIALWDRETRTLALARDRCGEKPLYYGWVGQSPNQVFVFGSELKALKAHPSFDAKVCRLAVAQYLRFLYVPAPRSIYQGIYKLEPGCLLTVEGAAPATPPMNPLRPGQVHGSVSVRQWWSLTATVEAGASRQHIDENDALVELEAHLTDAVRLQSLADVPLGAFLSGGVDSSTIVALMQRQSPRPIKTFTIGFDEPGFDESAHAFAVARHLGTEHYEMRVTAKMAQDVIPRLPWMWDEPFADSSQIPTHLVCKAAREHVTVALSGDAGDELFGGYNRYLWGPRIWQRLGWLPMPARKALGQAIASIDPGTWDTIGKTLAAGGGVDGVSRPGEKLHKLAGILKRAADMDGLYRSLVSEWHDPGSLVIGADGNPLQEPNGPLEDTLPVRGAKEDQLRMMYLDAKTYLPDDILCKVDRAAMATSLETRAPFLDHRVVEFAWRIPLHMKIRDKTGKWVLRQILYKHVPRELIERPKAGFAIPIGAWLRGPLRDWAATLLAPRRLHEEGYLHSEPIAQRWREHVAGTHDHTPSLWAVLMFQAWLEYNSELPVCGTGDRKFIHPTPPQAASG